MLGFYQMMADLAAVQKAFAKETDRSSALLLASYLDDLLGEAIRAFLIEDKSVGELFEGDSPLATFSSRIKMAYALGLLTKEMRQDADLVRKIRNEFAHTWTDLTLDTPPVSDFCRSFRVPATIAFFRSPEGEMVRDVKASPGTVRGNDASHFTLKAQFQMTIVTLVSSVTYISKYEVRRATTGFDYMGREPI